MTGALAGLLAATLVSSAATRPARPSLGSEHVSPPGAPTVQSDADTIRQRVKEGDKVRITDEQGREWQGRISGLAPDTLTLLTRDRQQRDLPYATILRIDRPHDSLANGALIGLGSGAALGLLAVALEESDDCEPAGFFDCGDPGAAAYVAAPLIMGGLGAAVGVGIDALIRKDPHLFRRSGASRVALAPAVRRGVRGVVVSVRW